MKSKKKVVLVGFPKPILFKSKKYVIETLYKRARKNPFLSNSSYDEYLDFLLEQMKTLGSVEIDKNSKDLESRIYDNLKSMKWLKVINAIIVGVIESTNLGV